MNKILMMDFLTILKPIIGNFTKAYYLYIIVLIFY